MTPADAYRRQRDAGDLRADAGQEQAVKRLDALAAALAEYRPGARSLLGLFRKAAPPPRGLYLWGEVGRGKSMLMDLFFAHAPVAAKQRVHFHAFMQDVHAAIFRFRNDPARTGDDPITAVAEQVFERGWLLCFDEFQVTDVADAMILGRLFDRLFDLGAVVVATSNRRPDTLYEKGLNRQLFLPFIALLQDKLEVLHLGGAVDYRLGRLAGRRRWLTPADAAAAAELERDFAALTDGAAGAPLELLVQGRKVVLPRHARGVARATFRDLCATALGPADYLAIAAACHTLILAEVPLLGPEKRNEARRFVTLVDALYEARAKLIASAAAPPDAIYPEGDGSFEFRRTASRLHEMQSEDWWAQAHVGAA